MNQIYDPSRLAGVLIATLAITSTVVLAAPVRLSLGHTDIGIAFEEGAFDLHIHDEANDGEYAPNEADLVVLPGGYTTVPNDSRYGFLGLPCSGLWILPQVQNTNLLFLGFGAEEIGEGIFQGNQLRMELKSFNGPGDFIVFDIDPFGTPIPIMNTRDGVNTNEAKTLPAGAHSDINWAFSKPGTYRVSFEASATLTNGTFVSSGAAEYTFIVEATNTPPAVLDRQHVDIGFAFEDNAWDLHVHNETDDLEYAPGEAVLLVRSDAFTRVPEDPRYSFLGSSCAPLWILPQVQNTNLLFLGFGAEEIGEGTFQGNQFRVELKSVSGPGDFIVFDIDSFGTPSPIINTRDGVSTNDARTLPVGAHSDLNWAFTQPGLYKVSFEASAILTNSTAVTSGPVEYTFCVENSPTPVAQSVLSIARAPTNRVTISWRGESGTTYQLQTATTLPAGWTDEGASIVGVCGTHVVTLPATNAAAFFRLTTSNTVARPGI